MKEHRKLWAAVIVLALVSSVGLYLPKIMRAGSAWGEWGVDEIRQMIGYAPAGMEKKADIWKAPIPDYALPGHERALPSHLSLSYILSAFVGTAACGGGGYLLTRWVTGARESAGHESDRPGAGIPRTRQDAWSQASREEPR
ncbi:MAG: PDGLE domain-containing protein [Candidatus Methylomirabilales bacterium]